MCYGIPRCALLVWMALGQSSLPLPKNLRLVRLLTQWLPCTREWVQLRFIHSIRYRWGRVQVSTRYQWSTQCRKAGTAQTRARSARHLPLLCHQIPRAKYKGISGMKCIRLEQPLISNCHRILPASKRDTRLIMLFREMVFLSLLARMPM